MIESSMGINYLLNRHDCCKIISVGDHKLKKSMERRRKAAEEHHQNQLKAGMANDDDFIIEDIFNSLTG